MESRYLYRAKRSDNKEWVEGNLIQTSYGACFINTNEPDKIPDTIEVDPSTVCQCVGYEGIFDGDIFQCHGERYVISWCDAYLSWRAYAVFSSESISLGEFRPWDIDVIGNKIDNPELMEVEA